MSRYVPEKLAGVDQALAFEGEIHELIRRDAAFPSRQRSQGDAAANAPAAPTATTPASPEPGRAPSIFDTIGGAFKPTIGPRGAVHDSIATSMIKSATRAASSQIGRQIVRGILGSFLGGSRR